MEPLEGVKVVFDEAPRHAHMRARGTFITLDDSAGARSALQPHALGSQHAAAEAITPGNTDEALAEWFSRSEIDALRAAGAIT